MSEVHRNVPQLLLRNISMKTEELNNRTIALKVWRLLKLSLAVGQEQYTDGFLRFYSRTVYHRSKRGKQAS